MTAKPRQIEIDAETADVLEARAAERGVSVSELVADLVREESALVIAADQISELDRRWAKVAAGEATIASDEVARWLQTWGKPAFRPWHEP